MTRYIKSFQNAEAIQEALNNEELLKPYVAYNESAATIDYNTKDIPLTFVIISGGTICWKATNTAYTVTLEYSKNGGEWTEITSNTGTSAPTITVESGDTVQFRGNNTTLATSGSIYNTFSDTTAGFKLKGNIMSLLDKDNFGKKTTLETDNTFNYLFEICTGLTDASNLILPATTLAYYCYRGMFKGCTSLTTAPELPATTLADGCYYGMFNNTNVLPDCSNIDFSSATVVASGCLKGLFYGTKVTDNDLRQILPVNPSTNNYYLPATTLASNSYSEMFRNCSSLTTAPELPATSLANYCYSYMFNGCTSLTTVPELPATSLANYCYSYMFNGCTSLTTVPELPATSLANYCYSYMFQNCTSLTTAPELPATTLAQGCYRGMFYGCTSLTTVPTNYLPVTTLADWCYANMFQGCTSLTTAPELPATTLANYCYYYMFYGCTSLTTVPELPATTLARECYNAMFRGCSSLNYIKCLATDISASYCTSWWLFGTSSTGTFVKAAGVSWPKGVSGVPTGWTVEEI